ncbi:ion channel [Modestobacter sp. VKM Ac-2979]|uniref:potassium channel family protein n=1 Tax=unclassified Modestobacter TaxID=2643866 RepID=UPI0022ABA29A|nr:MULTISPECIES: potassium channel family protein [unclassified Modestobacter]MCZ2813141.1 ion channel [Modestobacter sp. VKM Ac-2979]MCZ2842830.1 ion channel [Modestobacter sp. VKM Ac-2980]
MFFFFSRLSRVVGPRLRGWRLPLVVLLLVFLTSWPAMALVEGAESDIAAPGNYWWYFVVTAATVGYGDFFPVTAAGHVVGSYVIVGGIVTLTLLFTRLSDYLASVRSKRLKGVEELELTDHVVVLGYFPGRTERILAELAAEGRNRVALCAWEDVMEDPLPERTEVSFVRGDLSHVDVMTRANVAAARAVVIDGRDDNETLAIAVAVHHAGPDVHKVAALRDLDRRDNLRYVDPRIACVQWHMPFLITEEALDPGLTEVYGDLMSSHGHGNTYSVQLPSGHRLGTFGDCQVRFGQAFGATVLALRGPAGLTVSPAWDTPVGDGTTLYYVGRRRIEAGEVLSAR